MIKWFRSKLGVPCLIVLFFGPITTVANAAVSVTGVSGSVANGSSITISGSGFGSHSLGVEWTGANIEAGTTGSLFTKTGWGRLGENYAMNYQTDFKHSGSKSLRSDVMDTSVRMAIMRYTLPNPITSGNWIYVTWWSRYQGDTNGQWKELRISRDDTVVDGGGQIAFFNWFTTSDQFQVNPNNSNGSTYWPSVNPPLYVQGDGSWYRQEIIVRASTIGVADGIVYLNLYGSGFFRGWNSGSIATLREAGDRFNHVIFQNYLGNGIGSGQVWMDDIYISNTQARVEVCNTATWTARTLCEVQVPTAWSPTAITISGNRGSFPTGSPAYLYVLDASGNVNVSGNPVTIGSGGTAIGPPSNLRVVN